MTVAASLFGAVLFAVGGCTTYHAQPITPERVNEALAGPPIEAVRIAGEKLRHPLLAPMRIDGRDGFTPDEIAIIAIVASPRLRALRDQRGVAHAQVIEAGMLPNPQLDFSVDQPHGNTDPTLVTGRTLGLGADLTALLTRGEHVDAARATARSLDLDIAWQEWQVAQDARLRAWRLLSLEARLPEARELEEDAAASVAALCTALEHGLTTTTELTAATSTWTQAQSDRLALEQERNADQAALRLDLGLAPDASLALKAGPRPEWPPTDATAPSLLDGLEHRRLDLVALTVGYESEESTLRAAVRAQFPAIGLNVNRANDTSDVKSRGLGVTIDLPLFDRQQGAIATGRATRQQLFDEYVARVAAARSEVTEILNNLKLVRAQLAAIQTTMPDLQRQTDALNRAWKTHTIDGIAYRDARGALATRRLEQLRLQQDVVELSLALEIATGCSQLAAVNG